MTQADKDLLLKDLCARLPYGVKISVNDKVESFQGINILDNVVDYGSFLVSDIEEVRPYLFPLSSMTEEQRKEYDSIIYHSVELHCDRYYEVIDVDSFEELQDFYHINHLDYRGLIPMGLANDATNLNIY